MKTDNNRFLFPNEWKKFIKSVRPKSQMRYLLQFHTGGRFDEIMHIRPRDFDFDRNTVMLWKTKTKAKKGEKVGKPRMISLSDEFSRKVKRFLKKKDPESYPFKVALASYNQLLKAKLFIAGVPGAEEFSSHNIRKTHGMYLKAMGIDIAEICTRLGHDYNTYLKHYGSPSVFTESDMREIKLLMGDLLDRLRRRY